MNSNGLPSVPTPEGDFEDTSIFIAGSAITVTNGATNFDTLADGRFPISSDTAGQFYVARVVSSTVRPFIRYDISGSTATPTILSSQSAPTGGNWGGAVQNAQQFWLGRTSQGGATARYNRTTGQFLGWQTGQSQQGALITLAIANDIFYILDSTSTPTTIKAYTASGNAWSPSTANDITLTTGAGTVAMSRMRLLTAGTHIFVAGLDTARTTANLYAYTISDGMRDSANDITYTPSATRQINGITSDHTNIYFILSDNTIQSYAPSAPVWNADIPIQSWTIGNSNSLDLSTLVSGVTSIAFKDGVNPLADWFTLSGTTVSGTPPANEFTSGASASRTLARVDDSDPLPAIPDDPKWDVNVSVSQGMATPGGISRFKLTVNEGAIPLDASNAESQSESTAFFVKIWGNPLVPTLSEGFVNNEMYPSTPPILCTGTVSSPSFWIHIDFNRDVTETLSVSDVQWIATGGDTMPQDVAEIHRVNSRRWRAKITPDVTGRATVLVSIAEGAIVAESDDDQKNMAASRNYDANIPSAVALDPGPVLTLGSTAYSDAAATMEIAEAIPDTPPDGYEPETIARLTTFYVKADWTNPLTREQQRELNNDDLSFTKDDSLSNVRVTGTITPLAGGTSGQNYVIAVTMTNRHMVSGKLASATGNVTIRVHAGAIPVDTSVSPNIDGSNFDDKTFNVILQGAGPTVELDSDRMINFIRPNKFTVPIIWDTPVETVLYNGEITPVNSNILPVYGRVTNISHDSTEPGTPVDPAVPDGDQKYRKWDVEITTRGFGTAILTLKIEPGAVPATKEAKTNSAKSIELPERPYFAPTGLEGGWAKITPLAQELGICNETNREDQFQDAFEIEFSDDVEITTMVGNDTVEKDVWKQFLNFEGVPISDDDIIVEVMDEVQIVRSTKLPDPDKVFALNECHPLNIEFIPDLDGSPELYNTDFDSENVRINSICQRGAGRFYTLMLQFDTPGEGTARITARASEFSSLETDTEIFSAKYGNPNLRVSGFPRSTLKPGDTFPFYIHATTPEPEAPTRESIAVTNGEVSCLTENSDGTNTRFTCMIRVNMTGSGPVVVTARPPSSVMSPAIGWTTISTPLSLGTVVICW